MLKVWNAMGRWALIPNLLLLGFLGAIAWLEASYPGVYYESVQEDQALEWASFWSFFVAAGVFSLAASRQRRKTGAFPWFLIGLALFCMFVAMEEISWGQRVFGHRPPDYFLAENFQQEINVHNIASAGLRMFLFRGIILGYGVLLPLLGLVPVVRARLDRLAVVTPGVALMPSMFAMFWIHWEYPWKFTGEIIECALGFGFLFAALANAAQFSDAANRSFLRPLFGSLGLVVILAFSTASWSQNRRSGDPANPELAITETEALKNDVLGIAKTMGAPATKCGLHKRLYTLVQDKERLLGLTTGSYAALVERGLPAARAEFFLDPWNSPYWIRDRCETRTGRRVIFIYSFGPNRSRDSSRWEILGDDIGQYIRRETRP